MRHAGEALQHSPVGPFGLTEFPLRSAACIDNRISVASALLHPSLKPPILLLALPHSSAVLNAKVESSRSPCKSALRPGYVLFNVLVQF